MVHCFYFVTSSDTIVVTVAEARLMRDTRQVTHLREQKGLKTVTFVIRNTRSERRESVGIR